MKCASITKINLSKSNIEANSNEQILFDIIWNLSDFHDKR